MAKNLTLQYIYKTIQDEEVNVVTELTIDDEQVTKIQKKLLSRLQNSLIELDNQKIQETIAEIAEVDAALAASLKALANNMKYTQLLSLLKDHHIK